MWWKYSKNIFYPFLNYFDPHWTPKAKKKLHRVLGPFKQHIGSRNHSCFSKNDKPNLRDQRKPHSILRSQLTTDRLFNQEFFILLFQKWKNISNRYQRTEAWKLHSILDNIHHIISRKTDVIEILKTPSDSRLVVLVHAQVRQLRTGLFINWSVHFPTTKASSAIRTYIPYSACRK